MKKSKQLKTSVVQKYLRNKLASNGVTELNGRKTDTLGLVDLAKGYIGKCDVSVEEAEKLEKFCKSKNKSLNGKKNTNSVISFRSDLIAILQNKGFENIDGKKFYFCSNEDLFSFFVEELNPPKEIVARIKKGLKLKGHTTLSATQLY